MLLSARPCADKYCVTANSSVVTSFVRRSLPASPTRSNDAWRRNVWTMNRARSSALRERGGNIGGQRVHEVSSQRKTSTKEDQEEDAEENSPIARKFTDTVSSQNLFLDEQELIRQVRHVGARSSSSSRFDAAVTTIAGGIIVGPVHAREEGRELAADGEDQRVHDGEVGRASALDREREERPPTNP
jgi:hypothetical protein